MLIYLYGFMKRTLRNIIKIFLLSVLIVFCLLIIFGGIFSDSYDFFYGYFMLGTFYIALPGIIISFLGIILSIKKKKINLFCFYSIPIALSLIYCLFISRYKHKIWENEMYENAGIIDNYYSMQGVVNISPNELLNLSIRENVYITINEDKTYCIVNKGKNMVYISKWDAIWEEDGDF